MIVHPATTPYLRSEPRDKGEVEKSLVPVLWDSQHFEIPIARIIPTELNDSELDAVLTFARSERFHLVYWVTSPWCDLNPNLLEKFSGLFVDKKATFYKKPKPKFISDSAKKPNSRLKVVEFTQSLVPEQLLSLAVQSGIHSRFNVDPYIPKTKFQSMYHIWIKRSAVHELADVVFVAINPSNIHQYLGVITASIEHGVGKIGLMSVLQPYQGQGVGSLLMHAVEEWMHSHDVHEIVVVTQEDNLAACNFYARLGYRLESLKNFYHFWVQR